MENLAEELQKMNEWARAAVFDQSGKLLATKNCQPSESELQ